MNHNKNFGNIGEEIACDYLFNNGYSVIERNYTCKIGEIDIIALDHNKKEDELVFVEVKTRANNNCGNPADSVNYYKQRHIYRTAEFFLMMNKLEKMICRFDVIEVLNTSSKQTAINHIQNAIIDNPYAKKE